MALVALLAGLLGMIVGGLINARAGRLLAWSAPGRQLEHRPLPAPVLELGTGALVAGAVLCVGVSAVLPAYLWFIAGGVLLAVVDVEHQLLPRRIVWTTLAGGVVLLLVAAAATSSWEDLLRAVIAAGVLMAAHLVVALISPAGMGMGDVRLASVTGLYLGWISWPAVALGAVGAFMLQVVVAVPLLLIQRADRHARLPFGPAMLLAAALTVGVSSLLAR